MRKGSLALIAAGLAFPGLLTACSSSSDNGGGTTQEAGADTGAMNNMDSGSSNPDTGANPGDDSGGDATSPEAGNGTPEAGSPDASDGAVASPLAATKHVLLISVDGLHQVDLATWISKNPTSTLAKLAGAGVEYTAAHTTTPSDSFPGMLALVTGGTPKSTGVYYDDSYARDLYAPGPLGCTQSVGTEVVLDESVEYDSTLLFSGGINADNLPWQKDSHGNCTHVFPHNFVKVNTLFEVIKFAGFYTAWSDKHPAYDILNGPSGKGIDDLYTPEINSDPNKAPMGTVNGVDIHAALATCDGTTNSLALTKVNDNTTGEPTTQAYDDTKVQAVINWIDGKLSDGSGTAPVPTIFGMNFQAVSVGEKLPMGGYSDAAGTPSTLLAGAISHVDQSIGKMVTELQTQGLLNSTLIIISAKHGQSPVDKTKLAMEGGGHAAVQNVADPSTYINAAGTGVDTAFATPSSFANPNSGNNYDTNGHLQTDDVGLIWIQHSSDTTTAATIAGALTTNAAAIHADTLPAGTIFSANINSGASLAAIYGDPLSTTDAVAAARAPDIVIQPNWGVIYSGSSKKIAEHGGGTTDDTNVALLVSIPGLKGQMVSTPVTTTQVAPTILHALGLDPMKLQAVAKEGTAVLPSL
jgi:arylsulfatase A-like enzyme